MPDRIQLQRRPGWRKPTDAVVVARPARWGNPFRIGSPYRYSRPDGDTLAGTVTSAAHAVELYQTYLGDHPDLRQRIRTELAGLDLCCWCAPSQPCHADVLLALANDRPR